MKPAVTNEFDSKKRFREESVTYLDPLYRNALRLVRNPSEAEDLVQETFLKAFRYYDTFIEGSNLKAWLFKIQFNTFVQRYRRASAERHIVALIADQWETNYPFDYGSPATALSGDDLAARNVFRRELDEAIEKLPHDYQTILTLVDVEGLKYREIAEITAIPIGTVMSRIHRARKLLRESVKSREAAPPRNIHRHLDEQFFVTPRRVQAVGEPS